MFQYIKCPKCKRKIKAILKENRWVKWIEIYCSDCDYRKNIHDFDFIQPSSPFFKAIYGNDPTEQEKQKIISRNRKQNKLKENREVELQIKVKQGLLKPWELGDIKKYARENKFE